MKKLHIIYLLLAVSTVFTSCSYQNYSPMEAHLAPLTNNSYTANSSWNADHYTVASNIQRPEHKVVPHPVDQSIVVMSK